MDLSSWPMPLVAVTAAFAAIAATALIGALSRRFSPCRHDLEINAATYDVAKLIGGIIGLFMLFALTQGMNYYRAAEVATYKEAGDMLQLDRALAGIELPFSDSARFALHAYGRSLIDDEWPAMRHLLGSEGTEKKLDLLQLAVSQVLSSAPAAAVLRGVQKNLEDVEDDRTARIGAAGSGVPKALWWTLSGMSGILGATLFFVKSDTRQFSGFALYLASLAMLAALLFMVDGPYRGSFSVSSDPLQHAVTRMLKP
jgi:uncharacterized membrane protein